jgi:hypothetical protein
LKNNKKSENERTLFISKLLKMAEICFNLQNYDILYRIETIFNDNNIYRLINKKIILKGMDKKYKN